MIGDEIRRLRVERKLSLRELSRRSGIDVSNLSGIENGKRDPQVSTVERIAEVLGVRVSLTPQNE